MKENDEEYVVFINGKESKKTTYEYGYMDLKDNKQDFDLLISYSLKELGEADICGVAIRNAKQGNTSIPYLIFSVYTILAYQTGHNNRIEVGLFLNFETWKRNYSIREFTEILHTRLKENTYINTNDNIYLDKCPPNYLLKIAIDNLKETEIPVKYIDSITEDLEPLIIRVTEELDKKYQLDVYSTYFDFPIELKIACNQYLMYFAQFLLDLGIETSTEIKDTPKGTFFSVTPKNKDDAIEKIRQLLNEFMNAPGYDKFETELASYQDISAIQWHANVLHLKSQIAFANTQLQMKDAIIHMNNATINSLNLTNYELSEKVVPTRKKDEEQIIEGVLSVTTIEKFGGKLNLAELLRRLKRKF